MVPLHVLAMARSLGEISAEVFIVDCEPEDFRSELVVGMSCAGAKAGCNSRWLCELLIPPSVRAVLARDIHSVRLPSAA